MPDEPVDAVGDPEEEATASFPPSFGDVTPSAPRMDEDEESEVLYGGHARDYSEMFRSISGYKHGDIVRAMREGTQRSGTKNVFLPATREDLHGLQGGELEVGEYVVDHRGPLIFLLVHLMLERTIGRVLPSRS